MRRAALLGLAAGALLIPAAAAQAATFTVNSALDAPDDNVGDGVCHSAAGTCTLRAAVISRKGPGLRPF